MKVAHRYTMNKTDGFELLMKLPISCTAHQKQQLMLSSTSSWQQKKTRRCRQQSTIVKKLLLQAAAATTATTKTNVGNSSSSNTGAMKKKSTMNNSNKNKTRRRQGGGGLGPLSRALLNRQMKSSSSSSSSRRDTIKATKYQEYIDKQQQQQTKKQQQQESNNNLLALTTTTTTLPSSEAPASRHHDGRRRRSNNNLVTAIVKKPTKRSENCVILICPKKNNGRRRNNNNNNKKKIKWTRKQPMIIKIRHHSSNGSGTGGGTGGSSSFIKLPGGMAHAKSTTDMTFLEIINGIKINLISTGEESRPTNPYGVIQNLKLLAAKVQNRDSGYHRTNLTLLLTVLQAMRTLPHIASIQQLGCRIIHRIVRDSNLLHRDGGDSTKISIATTAKGYEALETIVSCCLQQHSNNAIVQICAIQTLRDLCLDASWYRYVLVVDDLCQQQQPLQQKRLLLHLLYNAMNDFPHEASIQSNSLLILTAMVRHEKNNYFDNKNNNSNNNITLTTEFTKLFWPGDDEESSSYSPSSSSCSGSEDDPTTATTDSEEDETEPEEEEVSASASAASVASLSCNNGSAGCTSSRSSSSSSSFFNYTYEDGIIHKAMVQNHPTNAMVQIAGALSLTTTRSSQTTYGYKAITPNGIDSILRAAATQSTGSYEQANIIQALFNIDYECPNMVWKAFQRLGGGGGGAVVGGATSITSTTAAAATTTTTEVIPGAHQFILQKLIRDDVFGVNHNAGSRTGVFRLMGFSLELCQQHDVVIEQHYKYITGCVVQAMKDHPGSIEMEFEAIQILDIMAEKGSPKVKRYLLRGGDNNNNNNEEPMQKEEDDNHQSNDGSDSGSFGDNHHQQSSFYGEADDVLFAAVQYHSKSNNEVFHAAGNLLFKLRDL